MIKKFIPILLISSLLNIPFSAKSAEERCAFPYNQTHYFDLRPISGIFKGYALFVSSGRFNGSEEVTVHSRSRFPDTGLKHQTLKAFDKKGEWSQPGGERLRSAMGGPLPAGEYVFNVKSNTKICEARIFYHESYIGAAENISAKRLNDIVHIKWDAPLDSDSFLVGLLPVSGEFPNDLFIISHPDHRGSSFKLRADLFPSGKFWILVRSNQHLPGNVDVGYIRESWAVSATPFFN